MADRGYEKFEMVPGLSKKGIVVILITPEDLLRFHPFVGRSHFIVNKGDLEEEVEGNLQIDKDSGVDNTITLYSDMYDRDSNFIFMTARGGLH